MESYQKTIEPGSFEEKFYRAIGFPPVPEDFEGIPLILRITLGNMDLLDSFYMDLPDSASDLSVWEVLERYFLCHDKKDQRKVKQRLIDIGNPDLLEVYENLIKLLTLIRAGKLDATYYINNGQARISPDDPISRHQQLQFSKAGSYYLLDLVIEIPDKMDPFYLLSQQQKDIMLKEFRQIFLLYVMDKFGKLPELKEDAIIDDLISQSLIDNEDGYCLTSAADDLLKSIINEAEFYIINFDFYGDVYIRKVDEIYFNTGHGENLLVPVFIKTGNDPYRALFISSLYLGSLDYILSDIDSLFSDDTFRDMFSIIPASPVVDEIGEHVLENVITEGKLMVHRQKIAEERNRRFEILKQKYDLE
ncbi:hypothetical protein GF312_19180 [Candidatus Poribacteria bacterium]|nr:hypothetical protein [Candidatus Poribacteria bacterium]